MDDRGFDLMRSLISEIEGAPYPAAIPDELFTIWYEHAQSVAQEALEYLNTVYPNYGKDIVIPEGLS